VPSRYWVDETDKEEKKKLVDSYRDALGSVASLKIMIFKVKFETQACQARISTVTIAIS
jgi:hypothetical protein